jgi:hypothetical protein
LLKRSNLSKTGHKIKSALLGRSQLHSIFYILINQNGITIHSAEKPLVIEKMQSLVGIEGEEAYIEVASYRSYSNPGLFHSEQDFECVKIKASTSLGLSHVIKTVISVQIEGKIAGDCPNLHSFVGCDYEKNPRLELRLEHNGLCSQRPSTLEFVLQKLEPYQ